MDEKINDLLDILERVYKCPSFLLDKERALDKIMEKYIPVRNEKGAKNDGNR